MPDCTEALNVNDNTQETNTNEETETFDFSNLENHDVTRTDRSDDNTTPSRTAKKQKTTKSSTTKATSSVQSVISYFENKKTSETKDDVDLLFLSYAHTIKKFSGKRRAETKLQIAQIISQQEIMHYEEQSSQQSQQPVLKSYVDVSRPSTSNSYNSDFNSYVSPPLTSPSSCDENHQSRNNSTADYLTLFNPYDSNL